MGSNSRRHRMAPQHIQRETVSGPRRAVTDVAASDDLRRTLRDDLLQDLLALGILTTTLRGRLEDVEGAPEMLPLLEAITTSTDRDVHAVCDAIARLEHAA